MVAASSGWIRSSGAGRAAPAAVSTSILSRVRYMPCAAAVSRMLGCQMMPPVSSPPRAVKIQPSSVPTLLNPRKIQVGTLTTSPAVPMISPSRPSAPQRNSQVPLKIRNTSAV
jgi:hypothetical protein